MITKYIFKEKKHKIAYFEKYVPNSKSGIIILHGLAEHKGRYIDFINKLEQKDISVFAFDLRGHGESGGRRGDVKNFNQLISDLEFFIKFIKSQYQNLKLLLFGHSFGGQIALVYAAKYKIDGLILSSPVFESRKIFKILPYKLMGFIKLKKKHSESSAMLEVSQKDTLSCHKFTVRLIGIMLNEAIKAIYNNINKLDSPTLILFGKLDPLVNYTVAENIFPRIKAENKTLKVYEDVKHRIVQNEGCDKRIDEIIDWIRKTIQKKNFVEL